MMSEGRKQRNAAAGAAVTKTTKDLNVSALGRVLVKNAKQQNLRIYWRCRKSAKSGVSQEASGTKQQQLKFIQAQQTNSS